MWGWDGKRCAEQKDLHMGAQSKECTKDDEKLKRG